MKKLLLIFPALLLSLAGKSQCQADYGFTNNANSFVFSDSSNAGSGTIISWLWTFGDQTAPSTQQNPTHVYDFCGNYAVTLTIVTNGFCTSSFTDTVLVNSGFSGSFTSTVDTTTGTVQFQAQPVGANANYSWDFGDASTGTGAAPSHQYASAGTYNVCVIISDAGGICTDTVCNSVTVAIAPPSCNATWTNNSVLAGQQTFTAAPLNLGWTYTWDFGDATTGNGFIATHTYTTSGTYTVCLTVTDSATMCTSQFCDTVMINFPATCPVSFTNVNLLGNMSFTATPFSIQNTYTWTFGDNTTGTGAITTHTYTTPGTYTVCVTMTTPGNCTSTFCDTVIIPNAIGIEEVSGMTNVKVYPVPAKDELNVQFAYSGNGNVTLLVTDVCGRNADATIVTSVNGNTTNSVIDLSDLSSGIYLLQIQTPTGTSVQRFVNE
jgi:PKD repeat protein